MDPRQQNILQAIVEQFIKTANPVGSMYLYESYNFDVSPATIRNEMAALEKEGYITQPHTSAGRVPTSQAYRMFVNQMQQAPKLLSRVRNDMEHATHQYYLKQTKEKLYDMVAILAEATKCVSFASVPELDHVYFIGVSNILKKPEFAQNPDVATRVIETLENDLYDLLKEVDIKEEGTVYIGDENVLPHFQSCSLLAAPYSYKGFKGVMGVLGPMRMDYAYNLAALRTAIQLL